MELIKSSQGLPLDRSYCETTNSLSSSPEPHNTASATFEGHSIAQSQSTPKRSSSTASLSSDFFDFSDNENDPSSKRSKIAFFADSSTSPQELATVDNSQEAVKQKNSNDSLNFPWDPEQEDIGTAEGSDTSLDDEVAEITALNPHFDIFENLDLDEEQFTNLVSSSSQDPTTTNLTGKDKRLNSKDPLYSTKSDILKALQEKGSLSHTEAIAAARSSLENANENPRQIEQKAFQSVLQLFCKLHPNTSTSSSPDAHLKNQTSFYLKDFKEKESQLKKEYQINKGQEEDPHNFLITKNAVTHAVIHAGKRSFYATEKSNYSDASMRARTGIQAAIDYFNGKTDIDVSKLALNSTAIFEEMLNTPVF